MLYLITQLLVHYDDAVKFTQKQRKIEPAVYNDKRLNELPIPNIDQQADNSNESSENEFDELNDDDHVIDDNAPNKVVSESLGNISTDETIAEMETDEDQTNNGASHANFEPQIDLMDGNFLREELEADPLLIGSERLQVKVEKDPIDIHSENIDALEELLLNAVNVPTTDTLATEDDDDDVVFFIGAAGLPKPTIQIVDPISNLVKRENDTVTGNMPFNEDVNTISLHLCDLMFN